MSYRVADAPTIEEKVITRPMPLSDEKRKQIEDLHEYLSDLERQEKISDSEFREAFNKARQVLELSDGETADHLRISLLTISEWANGECAPHPAVRHADMRALKKLATRKIGMHSGSP